MGQQWSCGKTSQQLQDRLHTAGPGASYFRFIYFSPCLVFRHVRTASCGSRSGKLIGHVFPVIQRDSSTYPLLSPPSRVGRSATSNKLQSRPRDGDRASASGVSLRRGDAEVQVGELSFSYSCSLTVSFAFLAASLPFSPALHLS